MKVLLISPTALDYYGNPVRQRRMHLPGLTMPMLAAVTPPGIQVRLICETTDTIPFDEHWDLVGLTGMGSGIFRAWQIADRFRQQRIAVVIGGIAASLGKPQWTLEHADSIVEGEAEELWPQVLADFGSGSLKQHYIAPRPPAIENIPTPRYDLMNKSRIGIWRPVQATRGCPCTCSFCSVTSFFHGKYRKRPVDQVVRDVRAAKRHGTHFIAFIDDNIGVDPDYCAQLWEALIPEKIVWMSQSSLHFADRDELVKLAYRSGCRMLSIGIETTDPRNLADLDKAWNRPERYTDAFRVLRKNGIEVSTEMMIGMDHDDTTVFDRTFRFIQENRIPIPRVHIITPVPGTRLFEQLVEEGRLLSTDFSRFSGGQVVFRPRHFLPEELQAQYWRLYERLFAWRSILQRIVPNRASLGPVMRGVVWGVNLHYRRHVHHRVSPGIV